MSFCLCTGAILQCPFGAAPAPFSALPTPRVLTASCPAGVMTDIAPMVNIPTFWQYVARGGLLLFALTSDFIRRRNRERSLLEASKKNA